MHDLPESTPCIVLLSGGLDSATTLAVAKSQGFAPLALTFSYGQRHEGELQAAGLVSEAQGATAHEFHSLPSSLFNTSPLINRNLDLPINRSVQEILATPPPAYVPARNTLFLASALARAEDLAITDLFFGATATDSRTFPDCSLRFCQCFEELANEGTSPKRRKRKIRIHTPLIGLTKAEVIRLGIHLGVDYSLTLSCYEPTQLRTACAKCDACRLRLRAFQRVGIEDPATYA